MDITYNSKPFQNTKSWALEREVELSSINLSASNKAQKIKNT